MKRIFALLLCAVMALPLVSCSPNGESGAETTAAVADDEKTTQQAFAMDTLITLTAYGPKADDAISQALKRVTEIENMASANIADSDISKINDAAGKEYVQVHSEVLEMIQTAVEYSKLTDGAFDITVGPLIKLWGVGTENERVPSADEIAAALELVGSENISIDEANSSVKLLKEGMSIDLGGIAKGFAADEVLRIFKSCGVTAAIINMGSSSIYTLGEKPDGTLWSVAIEHPRKTDTSQDYLGILKIPEQAVSTSGDYERYFMQDGKRYHHIMNPFTGYPAEAGIMSDTIVIDSSVDNCNMLADILTKATFVLGVDEGFKIIDSIPGVACLAVSTDYQVYESANWKYSLDNMSSEFTLAEASPSPTD